MSTKSSINYLGFDFDFEYNYTAGRPATWEDPEEYEEFEIYNITLNGIDASDLLDRMIDDFEEEVIKELKDY
jgi:hypothetical protein